MADITISCTCCGEILLLGEDTALVECPCCGTRNGRPRSTEHTLTTLQRAIQQRLACDFHNAELSYQQVLLFNPDEHEALWGRLLCRYSVEYVEDPTTGRHLPTVHAIQPRPMQEDPDFTHACEYAPESIREQYRKDAAYIDEAQAKIREMAASFPPYDVFLCHKTTKPGSMDKTEDFNRATQIYHFLKDHGVNTFFAPESLQNASGFNYEAGIYHALTTARAMLVICSDEDYLVSPWVRSEWARYLEMVEADSTKRLIPLLYDHFSAAKLPSPFRLRKLQGLDMTDINAPQNLLDAVTDAIGKAKAAAQEKATATQESVTQPSAATRAGEVILQFPRLIPEWKHAPSWKVVIDDQKHTVLTPVKWARTELLPLKEPVSLTVREARVGPKWLLTAILGTIAAFFIGGWATFFISALGCLVSAPAFLIWYIGKVRRYYRIKLTFTAIPGRRYRLYWDEDNKLNVEEVS